MSTVRFLDDEEITIIPDEEGRIRVSYPDGEEVGEVIAKRLFPHTRRDTFIHLIDKEEEELGIIRDMDSLDPNSQKNLQEFLERFYVIPKIEEIHSIIEEFRISRWKVSTDRGERVFEVKNRNSNIWIFPERRVLVKDSNENLYEIPDYAELPPKSRILLEGET